MLRTSAGFFNTGDDKLRSNKYFLLGILTLIGVLNFVDRQIMSILLEDIKVDLEFTDLELGLLSGTLFAFFYSFVGIPIARLADRWNRGKIVSFALFFWSAMTVVSGWAQNFTHLALARMGVGIGEAGVAPASHSLIADRFEAKRRATALAVYSLGGTVGIFLALSVGGWISDNYGWRTAFLVAGAPGIVLGLVAFLLIRDQRTSERFSLKLFKTQPGKLTLMASLKLLWHSKAWRYAAIATGLTHVATIGVGQWLPSYLRRSYELSASEAGLVLAFAVGICGAVGSLSGGVIADKLSASRGIQWLAWTLAVTFGLASLLAIFVFTTTSYTIFIALLAPYFVLALSSSGVQFAIAQATVTTEMRATSSALLILVINLAGLGLGPPLVGFISDQIALSANFAETASYDSLRYAMIAMIPFTVAGAWFFYLAGKELPREVIQGTEPAPTA